MAGMFGSAGKFLLNQAGINLLGRNFEAEKIRRQQREAVQAANMQAAGLLQPVPGQMRTAAIGNEGGEDISAAFAPQLEQGAARRRSAAEIAPELAMLQARTPGFNSTPYRELANFAKPSVRVGPDGSTYDEGDPGALAKRFATPTTINGWNVDAGAPQNRGAYFPKLPDGAIPDGRGGVVNATGLTGALSAQEEAQALGRTRGTMLNVPRSDGSTGLMTGAQYLGGEGAPGAQRGGFGISQAPGDAEYDKGVAKAEQERYQGLVTAGTNAGRKLATFRQISTLLRDVDGGRLTPAGTEIASALNSIGIKGIDKNLGNKQASEALMNQLVLEANGGSLGAGVSNADVAFLAKTGPTLMQSAQGRQTLINFAVAREERTQRVGQMARQWQQRGGRLDKPDRSGKTFYDYLDEWAEANPLVKP